MYLYISFYLFVILQAVCSEECPSSAEIKIKDGKLLLDTHEICSCFGDEAVKPEAGEGAEPAKCDLNANTEENGAVSIALADICKCKRKPIPEILAPVWERINAFSTLSTLESNTTKVVTEATVFKNTTTLKTEKIAEITPVLLNETSPTPALSTDVEKLATVSKNITTTILYPKNKTEVTTSTARPTEVSSKTPIISDNSTLHPKVDKDETDYSAKENSSVSEIPTDTKSSTIKIDLVSTVAPSVNSSTATDKSEKYDVKNITTSNKTPTDNTTVILPPTSDEVENKNTMEMTSEVTDVGHTTEISTKESNATTNADPHESDHLSGENGSREQGSTTTSVVLYFLIGVIVGVLLMLIAKFALSRYKAATYEVNHQNVEMNNHQT
ncbi:unnamed protein product [Parnassius apollo]|uniref:(apollo) hypothetical protein n=1 Tax=Parnassius apollo TaxID=110799 RepID=A0A8S3Y3Y2_PARAO|nr:unnamed protein product [Parnassius apollo]